MRRGLREIIPADDLRVFSAPELACMLGGVADIDVASGARTEYEGGYREESPQIRWLWRLVSRFSPEERTLLLKFVTGSSRMPVGGFAALRGMAGRVRFTSCVPAERARAATTRIRERKSRRVRPTDIRHVFQHASSPGVSHLRRVGATGDHRAPTRRGGFAFG